MLTGGNDEPAVSLHERRLEAQLDRMEKMLADLCRDSKDLKEVDPSPRPVLSDIAPSPVQDSGVSARALAVELETKPKETSEVLPTTPVSGLENDPQETRTSDTGERSHSASTARRFDRSHTTFHEAEKGHFWRLVHWILPTVDPKPSGPLADFVRSHLFERLSLSAILVSVCFTIYKTDYIASTLSDEQEIWMTVGESTILGIFVSELVMKMMVYGGYMLMSKEDGGWNLLDLIIVTFATVEMIMEHVGSGALEVGVMRVIRLLRVLKILRIFRAFRFLDELRLMVSCMLGSMTSLLWSIMLILVILLIAGLTFVQIVSQFQMDFPDKIAADTDLKDVINAHFSSVGLAMLELFMSTTGGREWGPLYDVVKQSGLSAAISFVLYIVFFTFAFVNIITAVFVDNALKIAEPDKATILLEKRRADKKMCEELSGLMKEIDKKSSDNNGMISWDDMEALHTNHEIRDCLDLAGIDISDVDSFFFTVCKITGSDNIDIDTFVSACFQMKGGASSLDMQTVLVQMHEMAMLLQNVSERLNIQSRGSVPKVSDACGSLCDI